MINQCSKRRRSFSSASAPSASVWGARVCRTQPACNPAVASDPVFWQTTRVVDFATETLWEKFFDVLLATSDFLYPGSISMHHGLLSAVRLSIAEVVMQAVSCQKDSSTAGYMKCWHMKFRIPRLWCQVMIDCSRRLSIFWEYIVVKLFRQTLRTQGLQGPD